MHMTHRSERQSNISRIVRALLEIKDREQQELAPVLEISESALSRRFSSGKWGVDDLDALAQFFGCPLSTFFLDPADLFSQPDDQGKSSIGWYDDTPAHADDGGVVIDLRKPYDVELGFDYALA